MSSTTSAYTSRVIFATGFYVVVCFISQQQQVRATSRVSLQQVNRQTNQFFLNEFCDLESKTMRSVKKLKQATDMHALMLNSKNSASSVRILPYVHRAPSTGVLFGFGSPSLPPARPVYKQLNCTINVVAPSSHGLLVTVNSVNLPKNQTKLSMTLNQDSPQAQTINLEAERTSSSYLITLPQSSRISFNLQSFNSIDWSLISFDILFTVYRKGNSSECPNKKWFDCGDNICVPSSLVCDNNVNCPNGNDEMVFYRCYAPLIWSIAASTAFAVVLVLAIIGIVVIVNRYRAGELIDCQRSFSQNGLATNVDFIAVDSNSSKGDLTTEPPKSKNSFLSSNVYLSGFENPVWINGTLSKQQNQTNKSIAVDQTSNLVVER